MVAWKIEAKSGCFRQAVSRRYYMYRRLCPRVPRNFPVRHLESMPNRGNLRYGVLYLAN